GAMTAMEVLVKQGFAVVPVEEQMAPDGQFPNVTQTPNPEVPASMDRAAETAKRHAADLVLATDPDADRLGAMVPSRSGQWTVGSGQKEGPSLSTAHYPLPTVQGYRYVNGNEIASLLTYFKLNKLSLAGDLPRSAIVIKTEVTTGQVTRIAR